MQTKLSDKKIKYDGSQLASHWILTTFGITGDAIVSFSGACDVTLKHMVDLHDRAQKCRIFSTSMCHFIVEIFEHDLERMVLRQRLLVSIMKDVLQELGAPASLERRGNDLYDGDAKINVSIATISPVSTLIHAGVNICSKKTPVKTRGLDDYKIDATEFASVVMKRFAKEMDEIEVARCKARWVN